MEILSVDLKISAKIKGKPVVARDGDINKLEIRVGIAKGNGGNVNVAGLNYSLSVRSGISDNQQSWFLELFCVLICQSSGGPS